MANNADIRRSDAAPGNLVLVGGLLLGGAGALMALVAVQFMAWWSLPGWAVAALWFQVLVGGSAVLLGRFVADGRPAAAIPPQSAPTVLTRFRPPGPPATAKSPPMAG